MIKCLQEIGLDGKDFQLIIKLYWDQTAVVRMELGVSSEIEIKSTTRMCAVT